MKGTQFHLASCLAALIGSIWFGQCSVVHGQQGIAAGTTYAEVAEQTTGKPLEQREPDELVASDQTNASWDMFVTKYFRMLPSQSVSSRTLSASDFESLQQAIRFLPERYHRSEGELKQRIKAFVTKEMARVDALKLDVQNKVSAKASFSFTLKQAFDEIHQAAPRESAAPVETIALPPPHDASTSEGTGSAFPNPNGSQPANGFGPVHHHPANPPTAPSHLPGQGHANSLPSDWMESPVSPNVQIMRLTKGDRVVAIATHQTGSSVVEFFDYSSMQSSTLDLLSGRWTGPNLDNGPLSESQKELVRRLSR